MRTAERDGRTGEENRAHCVTTGAKAVENAVKVVRWATGRPGIIAFGGGFHGRMLMGMARTGRVDPYKRGFGPFPAAVHHAPFPNSEPVLDVIAQEDLCGRAQRLGQTIRECPEALAARNDVVGDVRGLGAMVAFEPVSDLDTKAGDPAITARIVAEARGLVILSCGTWSNVIRLFPPLTIPGEHLAEGLEILEAADAATAVPQQSAA